jgi:predicted phage terminase large subunit-like protein
MKKNKAIKYLVATYFKNSKGEPYQLTDGECEIFKSVIDRRIEWLWISAPTRYGKTETLALAVIYLAVFENIKIPIVAGSTEKARKIMEYVVEHISDHPELYNGLINVKGLREVEKLKISISKDTLRWSDGGWIFVTSVDSRNISKEGEGVVGEGGDVVILEEAGLIKREEQFSKIVRMPEHGGGWGKLIMSGNCIEKSVFEKAYNDDLYKKVRIDLDQALREGRYTQEELDNKKTQTTGKDWKRYYLVKFPKANEFTYFKPIKYEIIPKEIEYYGAIDPSLGEQKKSSKIGIVVLARDTKGQVYEVESIVDHLSPDEAIRKIFNMPYKFKRFVFESVQFQKYFLDITDEKSKAQGLYIPFEGIIQARNKTVRIESLEPHINNKHILFKGDNQLWLDMQDYPETEFLDGLDALEMAWRAINEGDTDYFFV